MQSLSRIGTVSCPLFTGQQTMLPEFAPCVRPADASESAPFHAYSICLLFLKRYKRIYAPPGRRPSQSIKADARLQFLKRFFNLTISIVVYSMTLCVALAAEAAAILPPPRRPIPRGRSPKPVAK
jgi:hypothetical protein